MVHKVVNVILDSKKTSKHAVNRLQRGFLQKNSEGKYNAEEHSKWDSLYVRGVMFFLIRGIKILMLLRGIIFYLVSVTKLFWFVRTNNLKL